jgi:hypothetical protein
MKHMILIAAVAVTSGCTPPPTNAALLDRAMIHVRAQMGPEAGTVLAEVVTLSNGERGVCGLAERSARSPADHMTVFVYYADSDTLDTTIQQDETSLHEWEEMCASWSHLSGTS